MSSALLPLGTFGFGTMLQGGIPAMMTGALAGPYWGSVCGSDLASIVNATQKAHDPPLKDYENVAVASPTAPPKVRFDCAKYKASLQGYCHTLAAGLARFIAAQYRVQSLSGAIATTVARESGAIKAGDTKAVLLQDGALKGLLAQFGAARKARSASGLAMAESISAQGVQMIVPLGWFPTALNAVLSKLAARGVRAQVVEGLAPADMVTKQVNELAELSGP